MAMYACRAMYVWLCMYVGLCMFCMYVDMQLVELMNGA